MNDTLNKLKSVCKGTDQNRGPQNYIQPPALKYKVMKFFQDNLVYRAEPYVDQSMQSLTIIMHLNVPSSCCVHKALCKWRKSISKQFPLLKCRHGSNSPSIGHGQGKKKKVAFQGYIIIISRCNVCSFLICYSFCGKGNSF